jgi:hypothetical protein
MIKRIGFAALGLVGGFILGGLGPRSDIADIKQQLAEAEQRAQDAESRAARRSVGSSFMPGFGQAFGNPRASEGAGEQLTQDDGRKHRKPEGEAELSVVEGQGGQDWDDRPPMERFDLAVDAQRLRARQSRAALIEQADLDEEQVARADGVIGRMNEELAYLGEDVVDLMLSEEEPEAQDVLGVSHDVTGVLYEAQVELDAIVAENGGSADAEAQTVWNHLDLEGFRETVEDMDAAGFGPGRGSAGEGPGQPGL